MNRQSSRTKSSIFNYSLRDVAFIALTGVFCGAIFFATSLSYNFLLAGLSAVGLAPVANDLLLGLWMIAGPLAAMLTRKVLACTIGEILGSFVEMILGGQWGAATLISGLIQGVGSGLGFTMTGYRRFDKFGLLLSAITGTVVSFGWSLISEGYLKYNFGFLIILFIVRFISIGFFAGILVYWINKLVEKSGILNRD
ncbi:ECF transporter S component [Companilactobacillus ginsenosidimutans]|uniref:ABC transporter permease n=1 Tax=Companilactobacillus ginsenosidimutans TaxID=1007676 RepID=A0A0H4QLE7_9LACO|nr:ECF transporter S component [Companilactobacillus ginsenosidimutans]AKP67906.1 ABC transporter permease [Companilactobacillus ginsenosidimutans]